MVAHGGASGSDFSAGVAQSDIAEGRTVTGRVGDHPVLLSRLGGEFYAVDGSCTHYGANLSEGLIGGGTVRCPLHHACFSLRDGAALRAPALDPLRRWKVEGEGERILVRERLQPALGPSVEAGPDIGRIVIIGAGAAGLACANELRRLEFGGSVTMLSADESAPYDRPNLSKDFLAGTAPEDWLPLRPDDWYRQNSIDLRLGVHVDRIDIANRRVLSAADEEIPFDRLLIATGSEPNQLRAPGFDNDRVFTLRSVADARAIAARATPRARAAIMGSSFIGLEAAAALRKRDVEVTVIAPEHVPFESLFGADVGRFMQRLHENHGVRFLLGSAAAGYADGLVRLADGRTADADFVLVGVGVRPRIDLAAAAELRADREGVPVNCYLETCAPGIFAAGDIAAYPDPLNGEAVRIEHWVTAERQGQVAAAYMSGRNVRYDAVPFFWTEQFGVALRYVGHAPRWDRVQFEGDLESGDFIARYFDQGEHRASAAVGRDAAILDDERQFEATIASAWEPLRGPGIASAPLSVEEWHGA